MTYQLVLQWKEPFLPDRDRLIQMEDELIAGLGEGHDVDGHDEGAGEMNIFVLTSDPKKAFTQIREVLGQDAVWASIRVAYRSTKGGSYVVLWPEGLSEFRVL